MVDYSEFPTTPTGWQERQDREWQAIAALETEDAQRAPRRRVDLVALIPGMAFVVLAIAMMAGATAPFLFRDGGILWLVLIGAGLALLSSEVRKARQRR